MEAKAGKKDVCFIWLSKDSSHTRHYHHRVDHPSGICDSHFTSTFIDISKINSHQVPYLCQFMLFVA